MNSHITKAKVILAMTDRVYEFRQLVAMQRVTLLWSYSHGIGGHNKYTAAICIALQATSSYTTARCIDL